MVIIEIKIVYKSKNKSLLPKCLTKRRVFKRFL